MRPVTGETVAVLFVDLDGFKQINDSMGHEIGDEILRTVARRLQHCLRDGDTVARIGGDEFVICLPEVGSDYVSLANKLLNSLREPFLVEGNELYVTGSIGISLFPDDGANRKDLLRAADMAMYKAKESGRNCVHNVKGSQVALPPRDNVTKISQ